MRSYLQVVDGSSKDTEDKLKQIKMEGGEVAVVGEDDIYAATVTLHQRAGRTGWPRGSG